MERLVFATAISVLTLCVAGCAEDAALVTVDVRYLSGQELVSGSVPAGVLPEPIRVVPTADSLGSGGLIVAGRGAARMLLGTKAMLVDSPDRGGHGGVSFHHVRGAGLIVTGVPPEVRAELHDAFPTDWVEARLVYVFHPLHKDGSGVRAMEYVPAASIDHATCAASFSQDRIATVTLSHADTVAMTYLDRAELLRALEVLHDRRRATEIALRLRTRPPLRKSWGQK